MTGKVFPKPSTLNRYICYCELQQSNGRVTASLAANVANTNQ